MKNNTKIAFYCSGNFSELLWFLTKNMHQITPVYYLQNFKGLDFFEKIDNDNKIYRYQFSEFNSLFNKSLPERTINYNEAYQADKSHFKRYSGVYVHKVITTFAHIFKKWIEKDKPDFVFFPIIESLDSMVLYLVCKELGIKTIVYTHSRLTHLSFLSPDKYESFPQIEQDEWQEILSSTKDPEVIRHATILMQSNGRLSNQILSSVECLNKVKSQTLYQPDIPNAFIRLFKNKMHQIGLERHNRFLNNKTKFMVMFHFIFVPLGRVVYDFIEKFYLNPVLVRKLPKRYNILPLHFSPESSINTPAPYLIDQLRVVDKILLETNIPLVIREHPAVYGKRPLSFYSEIKKRPNIYFSSRIENYDNLLSSAEKIYSVTGTVAIEAFMKDKAYELLGRNLLTSFLEEAESFLPELQMDKRILFIAALFKIGKSFIVLPHNGKNSALDAALYSDANQRIFASALCDFVSRYK
jgi:hypothetical protein